MTTFAVRAACAGLVLGVLGSGCSGVDGPDVDDSRSPPMTPSSPTPTYTPTGTPTETASPTPTFTPTPTASPTPTAEPTPTVTPTATSTLEPSLTPTPVDPLTPTPVIAISEVMSINDSTLEDEDGDHPDWIELHNRGASPQSLLGWSLSDDDADDDDDDVDERWTFPDVVLPPDGYLVVFASDKDRSSSDGALHTDFKISGDGEALTLRRREDGGIEHRVEVPALRADVSWSPQGELARVTLVDSESPIQAFMGPGEPEDGWLLPEASLLGEWGEAALPLGVDETAEGFWTRLTKLQGGTSSLILALEQLENPDRIRWVEESRAEVLDFGEAELTSHFPGSGDYPGSPETGIPNDFLFEAFGLVSIPRAGTWTFGINGDDGWSIQIGDALFAEIDAGPHETALLEVEFDAPGEYPIHVRQFQWFANASLEVFAGVGSQDVFREDLFQLLGDVEGGGLAIEGGLEPSGTAFHDDLAYWLPDAAARDGESTFLRMPFPVLEPGDLEGLTLRLRYDDGLRVWLNGEVVVQGIGSLSEADTGDRDDVTAQGWVDVDLTPFLGHLRVEENILGFELAASQGDSADRFLDVALLATPRAQSRQRVFEEASPGEANGAGALGVLEPVSALARGGFVARGDELGFRSTQRGVTLRYTTDGSPPTARTGARYEVPLVIQNTTVFRAGAFRYGYIPSQVLTQTHIVAESVLQQNGHGFPERWHYEATADYAMDGSMIDSPSSPSSPLRHIEDIPNVSLVMPLADLFDPIHGIYANSESQGTAWEREVSMEWFDDDDGFRLDAGLRILGSGSRQPRVPKHGLRVAFRSRYGEGELEYDVFPGSPVDEFETLALKAGYNDSWVASGSGERTKAQYSRDAFLRETQRLMGQPAVRSRPIHLWLNGLYWGLYSAMERPDANHLSAHLGGEPGEWDALNGYSAVDGTLDAYDDMLDIAYGGLESEEAFEALQYYIDMPNFIDYFIAHLYGGSFDWDIGNWYAGRRREPGETFSFFVWDAEKCVEFAGTNKTGVNEMNRPSSVYTALQANPEFRMMFADRLQELTQDGGLLSPEVAAARFVAIGEPIQEALYLESARWGDARAEEEPYRPDTHWAVEQFKLLEDYFPVRTAVVIEQFRAIGLFPTIDAPAVEMGDGGLILETPVGQVLYALGGADPRLPGGDIAPEALVYEGPIEGGGVIIARVFFEGEWSARIDVEPEVEDEEER